MVEKQKICNDKEWYRKKLLKINFFLQFANVQEEKAINFFFVPNDLHLQIEI